MRKLSVMLILSICVVVVSFMVGRFHIGWQDLLDLAEAYMTKADVGDSARIGMIFARVRFPRVVCAFLAGVGLSVAGVSYQGVFRNPMVSPDILGATAGAGFGAAVALLLSFNTFGVQATAFVMGIGAVGITYAICRAVGDRANVILTLVLGGIVVSALFNAGISLMKYVADPYTKLPEITFWLMGSIAAADMADIAVVGIPVVVAGVPLFLLRWQINLLAFSDEEAQSMGVDTKTIRLAVIICATLITASVVSAFGIIGWVGLVMPHFARMIVGSDMRLLMPASIMLGGSYMVIVDDIARAATALEIPIGIITAIVGAPFFIYLLCKGRATA
ncbi:MAG: iron ABC transporter permease [Lachnospiraceae bacterium]|jgi:iron complex transport system permease protein|nr:iron ABC transporter permease [Lachnospiraceae bacterium]